VLTPRALNRALLARQMLLERTTVDPTTAVGDLVGMQAQAPLAPYVGLWSRLVDFDPGQLALDLVERRVVRASLMRSTIHLATADDALAIRPLVDPVLGRGFRTSPFARDLVGVDRAELLAVGRGLIERRPGTRAALGAQLAARWPGRPADSLVYAITYLVPCVQVPPRGVWEKTGPPAWTTMDAWLGRPLQADPSIDELVLRYLAAFGPATVLDVQAWSGLNGLRPVVERLRPRLATFRDERDRELFDLVDAPRPDPDVPAPPRFLPEYDNVLLGHADRSRIIPARRRIPLPPGNGAKRGTVLLDGMFGGEWRIDRDGHRARLTIAPFDPIAATEHVALEEEAMRLLGFIANGADPEIVVLATT
jgi:winged helix DNA-binding protein